MTSGEATTVPAAYFCDFLYLARITHLSQQPAGYRTSRSRSYFSGQSTAMGNFLGILPLVSGASKNRTEPEKWRVRVHREIKKVVRGNVATYGQIAELAGIPRAPRLVVAALRSAPDDVPWQRIVGKKNARVGVIRIADPLGADVQKAALIAEGVKVNAEGEIDLQRFGWRRSNFVSTGRTKTTRRVRTSR